MCSPARATPSSVLPAPTPPPTPLWLNLYHLHSVAPDVTQSFAVFSAYPCICTCLYSRSYSSNFHFVSALSASILLKCLDLHRRRVIAPEVLQLCTTLRLCRSLTCLVSLQLLLDCFLRVCITRGSMKLKFAC